MNKILFFFLSFATLSLFHNPKLIGCDTEVLPFIFQGESISENVLKKILHGNLLDSWYFEWKYIGQLPNGHHIIWSRVDESVYSFSGFHILKEEKGSLIVTDTIDGCRDCEAFGGEIKGEQVIIHRRASRESLLTAAAQLFPELRRFYDRSSKNGFEWYNITGVSEYSALIEEDGKVQETILISFRPYEGEGWPPYSNKVFQGNDIKKLAFDLLAEIDMDKPEELKEKGIAYSPICFQKLLEDDLEGGSLDTKAVNISEFKDVPFNSYDNYFTWHYIGQFQKYHLVYAALSTGDYHDNKKYFSGIYTILKEKDTLKKVARIAHTEGEENLILGECFWDNSPAFELNGDSLTFLQSSGDARTDTMKIKVQIDSDGAGVSQEILGNQATFPSITTNHALR